MLISLYSFVFGILLHQIDAYPSPGNLCIGKPDGDYPDAANCHGFISCSNDITHHMPCPHNLMWNDNMKMCDWPAKANPCYTTAMSPFTSPTITLTRPITATPTSTIPKTATTLSTSSRNPTTISASPTTATTTSTSTTSTQFVGCRVGQTVHDKCSQRCICSSSGTPMNCTRIRKEFTSMSTAEREQYVQTVLIASTDSRFKSEYDTLISLHRIVFTEHGIHTQQHFLPWHRWYILQYENLLRKVDCNVTVPYWDWSVVSGEPWNTAAQSLWFTGNGSFGGNGVLPNRCVQSGPFRSGVWQLAPSVLASRCLQRDFNGIPPDSIALAQLLNTPVASFQMFEVVLRVNIHDVVHCLMGGTMCSLDSASAPEFFLHHGMVDKIWADWQEKSNAHKEAFFPDITTTLSSTDGLLPRALIDNEALPGGVRVEYTGISNPEVAKTLATLRSLSPSLLRKIPRVGFSEISERTIKLFCVSEQEERTAKRLEWRYQPEVKQDPQRHNSSTVERKLGFNYRILYSKDTFCKGKPNGDYPDSTSCHSYLACSADHMYRMPCPAGLMWNDIKKQCDWPQYANPGCAGNLQAPPRNVPSSFCSGKFDGDYPDVDNCHGFIACSNGWIHRMDCPAKLMWNDIKKQCDWPNDISAACSYHAN